MSGNRACGLAHQLKPLGVAVSKRKDNNPPQNCANSNPLNFCVVSEASFPWLALYLGSKARVDRVEIWNRKNCCGHRLRNLEVRVTDSLPSSGILCLILPLMTFSGEERFQEGTLVGTYDDISKNGELISMEASEVSAEGRYVVLQKDNDGLSESQWQLHVGDFAAFGEYTTEITGYMFCTPAQRATLPKLGKG